jgi:hypothetical protein
MLCRRSENRLRLAKTLARRRAHFGLLRNSRRALKPILGPFWTRERRTQILNSELGREARCYSAQLGSPPRRFIPPRRFMTSLLPVPQLTI